MYALIVMGGSAAAPVFLSHSIPKKELRLLISLLGVFFTIYGMFVSSPTMYLLAADVGLIAGMVFVEKVIAKLFKWWIA